MRQGISRKARGTWFFAYPPIDKPAVLPPRDVLVPDYQPEGTIIFW
jgi:hypothetical protein